MTTIPKFKTVEDVIEEQKEPNPLDTFASSGVYRRSYCKKISEQYADQFAYHFLLWFLEEEDITHIHPTGTDIESYIHDFKESLTDERTKSNV